MNSHSEASHRTSSDKWRAGLLLAGVLGVSYLGFEMLPWPRFTDSGWLIALLLIAGGTALDFVLGGRRGPDIASSASMVRYGAGALLAQSLIHLAAMVGA